MPDKQLNILFLGGARRVSVGRMLIDAATKTTGIAPQLYSYELAESCPISSIAKVIVGLRWIDPGLSNHLCGVIDRYNIDIVVPFVDPAVAVAARLKELRPQIFAPVCDARLAEIMFDKVKADALFRSLSMPLPVVCNGYPVIAKPRYGSASKGIITFKAGEELPPDVTSGDYLLQRYVISREEVTVDCYVTQSGEIITISPRVRLEVIGGEVVDTMTIDAPQIVSLSRDLIVGAGLRGTVTLQFIIDLDSPPHAMVMEVNPRLGGGVVCSVHAGADIPAMIIDEALSRTLTPMTPRQGVRIARYLQETVVNA